ncbi:ribosomal protein S5 domain 2-type protein [Lanmaoa asiatica]|nr:ribosomal protein S5 domain 2-type protein [Lanmaoa asiatica]
MFSSIPVAVSPPRTLHASKFVAYASHIDHPDQVPHFLGYLSASPHLKRASHLIFAYRTSIRSGAHDGGEHGAGARLERLLELRREQNVVVVVARWYGGVKLGPERWRCISHVAKQALDQLKPPRT